MSELPLSVIIVTHNHAAFLPKCLETLIPEVESSGGELIIVDNCSNDESVAIVSRYPGIQLYVNQIQRGFSANANYGMAIAQGRYLLLLNPDTEILPNALSHLIHFMDNHPHVGLCGAQLLFPDGQIQPSPRRFPTLGSFIARRTPLRIFLNNSHFNKHHLMFDLDHSKPQEVDWLLGACLFVRKEILDDVGPLDEGYFLYVEDIDWARRIHQAGWKVYYVPSAQIMHYHQAISDRKFFNYRTWVHTLGMLRYTRKHFLPNLPWLSIKKNEANVWNSANKQRR